MKRSDYSASREFNHKALEQFTERYRKSCDIQKIDNTTLVAGQPMSYYCHLCGVHVETLPEDHLFSPHHYCSQCYGLRLRGLENEAKKIVKIINES